jgi:hypothetical protein
MADAPKLIALNKVGELRNQDPMSFGIVQELKDQTNGYILDQHKANGDLVGLVRGGAPFTAAEISGDGTTSGSNVLTVKRAATLTTPRAINGVLFDGSAPITITAGGGTVATKGDIQTYSTAAANLAVGADGKVLVASSAAATGLSYAGGLVQISKITTSASQATVDFTSIPATYTDLMVMWQARSNISGVNEAMSIKFNNDGTSGNYTITEWWQAYAVGSSVSLTAAASTGLFALSVSGNTSPTSHAGTGQLVVNNYLGTTFYKQMNAIGSFHGSAGTSQQVSQITSGTWKNTAAVTRLTFSVPTSFVNGSVFTLYGVGTP